MGETVSIEEYENLNEEELLEKIKEKENELEEMENRIEEVLLIISRIKFEIIRIKCKFESLQPKSPKSSSSTTPCLRFYYTLKYTGGRTKNYGYYSTRERAESMIPEIEYYGEYEVLEIPIKYKILRKLDKWPILYEGTPFSKVEKMPHLRKCINPSLGGGPGRNKYYPRYNL